MDCSTCGKTLSFLGSLKALGTKWCDDCNTLYTQIIHHWQRTIEQTFINGGVPVEMEQALYHQFQEVRMPQDLAMPVIERSHYLRKLSEIHWGNVPIVHTGIHLDSDEMAHCDMQATYFKPNKKVKPIAGRLIGTNKKCYFLSDTGNESVTLDWNNVSKIDQQTIQYVLVEKHPRTKQVYTRQCSTPGVHLTVSRGTGGGSYSVSDPLYTKILLDTLVCIWKRQLVLYKETATHGAIPEHVKAAVFKRDHGKCVQCGYEGPYIEYDHRIPRSKGGPNTIENIQLLCRMCNLKKGKRI
ncbi:MAG: HNH endonuclease [Ktedonobacteraceae bacterium]|nr:HNH endonuclease [Ktedonobacteraceae bacterium]